VRRLVAWSPIEPIVTGSGRGHRSPRQHLRGALAGFDGKWVALLDGEVVAASESPYDLSAKLREAGVKNASIIRAPGADEPEMVAFG